MSKKVNKKTKKSSIMLTDMFSLRDRLVIAWWVITATPFEFRPVLKKRNIVKLPEIYVEL